MSTSTIHIIYKDAHPNGLAMMMGQYLEQNFTDFSDRVELAKKLNISTSFEVNNGIVTSIRFSGDTIQIENGFIHEVDLHIKGDYLVLSDVIAGKSNSFKEIIKGKIKICKIPYKKPFQSIRLLKILKMPKTLLMEKGK